MATTRYNTAEKQPDQIDDQNSGRLHGRNVTASKRRGIKGGDRVKKRRLCRSSTSDKGTQDEHERGTQAEEPIMEEPDEECDREVEEWIREQEREECDREVADQENEADEEEDLLISEDDVVVKGVKKRKATATAPLAAPAPGGPSIVELIPSYSTHRAPKIWSGERLPILKVISGEGRLKELMKELNGSSHLRRKIESSSLMDLHFCTFKQLNAPLITAFVERWHPETCSFHLPFGEMTITLYDVQEILGLAVDGEPVCSSMDDVNLRREIRRTFGASKEEVNREISKGGLRMEWIKDCEGPKKYNGKAVGYLLRLIGSTIIVHKSDDRVKHYLHEFLMVPSEVDKYAWGAAVLANVYSQLNMASRAEGKQIGGCNTLIEAFIYEHFPMFRPSQSMEWHEGLPRCKRWCQRGLVGQLESYRLSLDRMTAGDVIWNPYEVDVLRKCPMALYYGTIHCGRLAMPHMPLRVMRQFGFVQSIPPPTIRPVYAYWSEKAVSCDIRYEKMLSVWLESPDMLWLIASRYKKIVVNLDPSDPISFFPLMAHPNEAPVTWDDVLCVAFVNGNHYIPVKLANNSPLPRLNWRWSSYRNQLLHGWDVPFQQRIDAYNVLYPPTDGSVYNLSSP